MKSIAIHVALLSACLATLAIPVQAQTRLLACPGGNYTAEALTAINALRAHNQRCGKAVGALTLDATLLQVAQDHANDMASKNRFSHANSRGDQIGKRARQSGYAYSMVGENIAAGQQSVAEVITTWLDSPSHCSNMMTASFVHMGISCQYNPKSEYQTYWTLTLGSPSPSTGH
ncbi:MAG TPA: CAP domain-containing protein [Burkholderiaceae bacterium]|nr:CAP domain-containing protein [Burkholderiaceae bacterium]